MAGDIQCNQTNIPTTDNTPLACPEFTLTDCIIYEEAIAYLGLPENSPMTDVVENMMLSLIDARNRVEILESVDVTKINGFFDYNDLTTSSTPISVVGGAGYTYLTNDGAGAFTNKLYPPNGVTDVWDTTLNQFDFSQLSLGSKVETRLDIEVTTSSPNTAFSVALEVAIGGSPYDISWINSFQKTAGVHKLVVSSFIYVGDSNTRDNPAKFKIQSDENIDVKVLGWASYINLY